ncbi:unnamed protein product [Rhizoctonia solani]|uniref:Uncharacterized protein n=1 Tax=Rhizoctonia solani TaxID=456999 RepID=A0A8H3HUA2_9AGAM|nr:unnamed protein product [Rhizoctonia solani]
MIDFANRRFTIRIGRASKRPLKTGEHIARRTSTMSRKTSTRRVSVRNSAALKRAPSGAGGLHRGASVHRSQPGLRRGASVKRAPSAARRNSKRISTIAQNGQRLLPEPESSETAILGTDKPESTAPLTSPVTSPTSPKSFFSKLTSRFRGRSKVPKAEESHPSLDLVTQGITGSLTATPSSSNLAPLSPAPKSPSLRSPSPGSRVTFVDTVEPTTPEKETSNHVQGSGSQPNPTSPDAAQKECPDLAPVIVDDNGEDDGEWVDAEDEADSEPRKSAGTKLDDMNDLISKGSPTHDTPRCSGDLGAPVIAPEVDPFATGVQTKSRTEDQPDSTGLPQTSLLGGLPHDTSGPDGRVSQWLADTPLVQVHDEVPASLDQIDSGEISGGASIPSKRESKRPRPPQIIVPTLSSNNPYRVPLPPSPSGPPSTVSEISPFRSLFINPGLTADTLNAEETMPPPSPSILLTPALEDNGFDLNNGRKSNDALTVDYAQIPLPPSPSPSNMSAPLDSEEASPTADNTTIVRANSMSTVGGRSLSTSPSTRGPTTPTSMRFPGHPSMAHFSFGGPKSPSLNVEDWEAGEEERRGRSLEVQDGKRRMRSVSPKLDAVHEGDETRRSSKASLEVKELDPSSEDEPTSPLALIEESVTFGKKGDDDSESEHEDECGFFAFAERQMEEEKKVAETLQANAPKRSKTMSFLSVGFGKRKSAIGELPSVPRSSTSSRLLGLPGSGPKRSSTLIAPSAGGDRLSRLMPGQRSSTLMAEPPSPREAVSPTIYTAGDIQSEAGKIEDDESRRLCEAAFMF